MAKRLARTLWDSCRSSVNAAKATPSVGAAQPSGGWCSGAVNGAATAVRLHSDTRLPRLGARSPARRLPLQRATATPTPSRGATTSQPGHTVDQPPAAHGRPPSASTVSEASRRDDLLAVPTAGWRPAMLVTLCLLVAALSFQSGRALWEPDEGRYTAVALHMLDSGDWLLPQLNEHREHLTKPPLTYWALAASMAAGGRTEAAARLPNALAFVLTGLLVWMLAKQFQLRRPWLAVYVWASALLPLLAANVVTTDTLLACWQTAAMYAWWRMQAAQGRWLRVWRIVMWMAFGLGFLTKGPPALLPLLPILFVSTWPRGRATTPRLLDIASAIAFLVLGLGWFMWLLGERPELLGYFLGHEFFDRLFSDVHGRNAEWYGALKVYLPALFLAAFPWGFYAVIGMRRRGSGSRRAEFSSLGPDTRCQRFLWAWLLIPLAVFVIAQSRLILYVLPLAVPVALLIARTLDARWHASLPRGVVLALCAWAAVALAVKGASTGLESFKDARALAAEVAQLAPNAKRLAFVDVAARYGLRFYLDLPVEQVGSTIDRVPTAHGQRGHLLCEELVLSPGLTVISRGALLGDAAALATRPHCPGWVFTTPREGSGLWLPAPAPQSP